MKFFGKRKEPAPVELEDDRRSAFSGTALPRHAGPPASSSPLADYLEQGCPGVDAGYVVLPRSVAEQMPLPWQQQMMYALAQFHEAHGQLSWPVYRVLPSRRERLVDLDEEQLAAAGYLVEIDGAGELVYRERNGRTVHNPEQTMALVTCLDPIVDSTQASDRADEPHRTSPAPMNVGPEPVWDTERGKRLAGRASGRFPFSAESSSSGERPGSGESTRSAEEASEPPEARTGGWGHPNGGLGDIDTSGGAG